MHKTALVSLLVSALFGADRKAPATGNYSNDNLDVQAVAYITRDEVQQLLGSDLGGGIVVVDLKITPRLGTKFVINRDEFILRSDKDGQRTQPYSPSQIAGSSTLMISQRGGGGAVLADNTGPVWGGIGGRPRRMGGDGGVIGNSSVPDSTMQVETRRDEKENPLLDTLKKRVLPEKEIEDTTSGLLYFQMDGKHKVKDLELLYRSRDLRFAIRFRQP